LIRGEHEKRSERRGGGLLGGGLRREPQRSPRREALFTRAEREALAREEEASPASVSASISRARGEEEERGSGREEASLSRAEARERSKGARRPLCCQRREARAWQRARENSRASREAEAIASHGREAILSAASDRGGKEGKRGAGASMRREAREQRPGSRGLDRDNRERAEREQRGRRELSHSETMLLGA
jgi:hypothetical protein